MYKIIAFDFDGTILNSKHEITKKTNDYLLELKSKGYIIIGITARALSLVKCIIDTNLMNYVIINNGANIYKVKDKKYKHFGFIDKKIFKNIVKKYDKDIKFIDVITPDNYYMYKENINKMSDYDKILDIDKFNEKISRMNVIFEDSVDLKQIVHILNNNYDSITASIMASPKGERSWININKEGVDKLSTLKYLLNKLEIDLKEVIFFGDGLNDIVLLNNVGMGVAMKNGLECVKKCTKYQTKFDNDHDGIYKFLKELNL